MTMNALDLQDAKRAGEAEAAKAPPVKEGEKLSTKDQVKADLAKTEKPEPAVKDKAAKEPTKAEPAAKAKAEPAPKPDAKPAAAAAEPEAKDERVARAMAQVARGEQENIRQRQVLTNERQQFQTQVTQVQQQMKAMQDEITRLRGVEGHLSELRKGTRPIDAMKQLGVEDFDDFVRRVAEQGTPSAQMADVRTGLEAKFERLEAQLKEEREWRQGREEAEKAAKQQANTDSAVKYATDYVDQNGERFPELASYSASVQSARMDKWAIDYFATNKTYPTLDMCAEGVEADLVAEETERLARKAARNPKADGVAAKTPATAAVKGTPAADAEPDAEPVVEDDEEAAAEATYQAALERARNSRQSDLQRKPTLNLPSISNRAASERTFSPTTRAPSRQEVRRQIAAKHAR